MGKSQVWNTGREYRDEDRTPAEADPPSADPDPDPVMDPDMLLLPGITGNLSSLSPFHSQVVLQQYPNTAGSLGPTVPQREPESMSWRVLISRGACWIEDMDSWRGSGQT